MIDCDERPKPSLAAMALLLLVALVYANSLRAGFTLDAGPIIRDDPRLQTLSAASLKLIFTENYWWPAVNYNLYRPLTTLSYLLNRAAAGPAISPVGFHLVNLLIHWLNALLIFRIFRRLMRGWWALGAAALFAIHPLGTESVTNLVGRADLLSTLAMLAGLICHIHWARSRRLGWLMGAGLAGMIGVFCKESAVALIAVVAAWDLFSAGRRSLATNWPGYMAQIPALAAFWAARRLLLETQDYFFWVGAENPLAMAGAWTRVITALSIQGRYLGLFFRPAALSNDYSFNQIPLWGESWKVWAWLSVLAAAAGIVVRKGRRNPAIWLLATIAAAVMGPTSNLLMPIGTIMAERFMYLPVACLAGILALMLDRASLHKPALIGAAAAVLIGLGVRSATRNLDWKDDVAIWSSASRTCPESFKPLQGLCTALIDRDGLPASADRVVELAGRAVEIVERLPMIHRPMTCYALLAQGRRQQGDNAGRRGLSGESRHLQALQICERGLEIDRAVAEAWREHRIAAGDSPSRIAPIQFYQLHLIHAVILDRLNRPAEALAALEATWRVTPGRYEAYQMAAELLERQGRLEAAAIRAWNAILIQRQNEAAWNLLQRVYGKLAPDQEVIAVGSQGFMLNSAHSLGASHLDAALADVVRHCIQVNATQTAQRFQRIAREQFGRTIPDAAP